MSSAVRIAAVVVAGIALISDAQALGGIVIVDRTAAIVAAARAIKLRTQILCGARSFRTCLHAHAAGEAGSDHYGLSAASHGLKFHNAFIHIHFSESATVNLNVKLGAAHRNHGTRCTDLESRRASHTLLDLRAYASHQELE